MIGHAVKIAQSVSSAHPRGSFAASSWKIGMHRDGTDFGLSYIDTQLRRQIWWELIVSAASGTFRTDLPRPTTGSKPCVSGGHAQRATDMLIPISPRKTNR